MEKELYRSQEVKKVTVTGIWINALLTTFKLFAGVLGKSQAMLADGMHSLSDFVTDIIVLIGFKFTQKPEDACHNYGHDKYETLVTAVIGILLAAAGFGIFKTSIVYIMRVLGGNILPRPRLFTLAAAGASIILKEFLYQYTLRAGKRIKSPAVKANAWHHRSDALSSIGTLIGIGGAIFLGEGWTVLDPIASVVVSILIFKVAIEIFLPAVNELLESSLSQEEIEHIKNIIETNTKVLNFHKLRTRRIGTKAAIEFHILLDQNYDLKKAHDVATEIEEALKSDFNDKSIITIHVEPFE